MTPLALLLACQTTPEPYASARVMEDLSDGIGGPKALARPGDIVLENDRVRVAITQPGASMGPSLFGGSIIDADLQRAQAGTGSGFGNDRLAELFPTVNMNVMYVLEEASTVEIIADGTSGGAAIVRVQAPHQPFLKLLAGLWSILRAPDFSISTDYIVEPGQPWVTLRTTAYFAEWDQLPEATVLLENTPDLPLLSYAVETGLSFGDFFLQGGDMDVFAPGIGFDENGAVDQAVLDGKNTFLSPFELDFVAGTADGVSYGIAMDDGPVYVPLFTSSQTATFGAGLDGTLPPDQRFPAGSAYTYERRFFIGKGDVGSVLDGILEARGTPTGQVHGFVVEEGSLEPLSGVSVFVYPRDAEMPYSQWESDVGWDDPNPDGSFGGHLPPGAYDLVVHEAGAGTGPRVAVDVVEGRRIDDLVLTVPRAGLLDVTVIDEDGLLVPSKITVHRDDGDDGVQDPVLGDGYIGGRPEAVVFNPFGASSLTLPPGDYVVYATRGPEYEIGQERITVSAARPVDLELQVLRSVDTTGWVSADLHVHSNPSHDSGVTPEKRIATMASEHVEFLVTSDHDYVSDFRPVIEDMGMTPWVASVPGVEVTTVEAGHYLGFPVGHDHLAHAGGAFDWTESTPDEMLSDLRELGVEDIEPVTVVAHPRDGILGYFDQYGYSPYGGSVGEPLVETSLLALTNLLLSADNFSLDFDAIELLNGKRYDFIRTPTQPELDRYAAGEDLDPLDIVRRTMEEQEDLDEGVYTLGYGLNGQVDDWFSLLNLGFRFTAVGNSDTHGTTSTESGCPRNYVVSTTDDPGWIDPIELSENIRSGHVVTGYGPFVRFSIGDAIVGDEVIVEGDVEIDIEVQAPTWMSVDRMELYRNGVLIEEWTELDEGVLRYVGTVTDQPAVDSWYVLIVTGSESMEPLYTPVDYAPVQLQDVVTEALSSVEAVGALLSEGVDHPRVYPVTPFALTNPIYVDVDGNGWSAPGLPDFMLNVPVDPNAEE